MGEFIGTPSLAHMRLLYGPHVTERELDAALGPFYELRDKYRRQFQECGIAISHSEAVEAFKLVAPLLLTEPDPQYTEQRAVMNAITFPCAETGGFGFRMPVVRAILEEFEREIAENSRTLYLKHVGETQAREVSAWDRFIAYRTLEFFVAEIRKIVGRFTVPSSPWIASVQLTCDHKIAERLTDELRSDFERATAILAARTVNRPRGQYDARLGAVRGSNIATFLHELKDCGLDVTSLAGASLAGAMAEAFDIPERTIQAAWNAAPTWFRPDMRPRERFADIPCARCGCLKVPTWRAQRGGNLCDRCSPQINR